MKYELGIIGAGNMAEAIARGVLRAGLYSAEKIIAADVSAQRRALFTEQLGIACVANPADAAREARVILLSVKPQVMGEVLRDLSPVLTAAHVIISIAAGISSQYIENNLDGGKPLRVIRSMPNTPMLVGQGMVAISPGRHATALDMATAKRLFESAASVIEVTEDKMDAVTAISGSGPAYFFFLVEQMIRAGVELGLNADQAHLLATKTALGASFLLSSSSDSPAELRRKVTSPGGTTHAAISHKEKHNLPQIVIDAIKAAANRSRELGK